MTHIIWRILFDSNSYLKHFKTQNLLIDRHHSVIKISDFGISKVLSSKSKAMSVVGTPCYISPEVCEHSPYNQKSDIWAVGCILYELMTLKRAFEARNLPALVTKIMRADYQPPSPKYSSQLRYANVEKFNRDHIKWSITYIIYLSEFHKFLWTLGQVQYLVDSKLDLNRPTNHQINHSDLIQKAT